MDRMGDVNGIKYYRTTDKAERDFNLAIWYDGETKADADWIMGFTREEPDESNAKGQLRKIKLNAMERNKYFLP